MGARAVRELVSDARRIIQGSGTKPEPESWNRNGITAAWIGHATVLINFYGLNIITDPVLFHRVGANTPFGTIGAKRLVSAALTPEELPNIDMVLLSHAHMDHLDGRSLRALKGSPHIVTARNTLDLLNGVPHQSAAALGWGDSTSVKTSNGNVRVSAFPVRHWGARWRYDTFRGYNGYVIEREGKRLLFGGDTALTDTFRPLRSGGPIELAVMPIGAYNPWTAAHCSPEEALRMANDAGAKYFMPVHFKTFPFGREGSTEPIERLQAAIEPARLALSDVGQTFRCAA